MPKSSKPFRNAKRLKARLTEKAAPGYTIVLSEDGRRAIVTVEGTPPIVNVIPVGSLGLTPVAAGS